MKLTNLVLAGAMALGIAGCKETQKFTTEFDSYKCERHALGQNRLPDFHKDGYKSEIRVYEDGNLIIKYVPATKESCEVDPQCGNHLDAVSNDTYKLDMCYDIAQKCEELLEEKYKRDF